MILIIFVMDLDIPKVLSKDRSKIKNNIKPKKIK